MAEIESSRPGFLTPAEAAFVTGRDTTAIYLAIKNDKFPNLIKLANGRVLLPIDEVKKVFGEFIYEPPNFEREDVRLCAYGLLLIFFTTVRSDMIRSLKWGQINWDEGVIEYRPATKTAKSEHKTGHHSSEKYFVVISNGVKQILQAMQEWAQQNNLPMGKDDYVLVHGKSRVGLDVRHGRRLARGALRTHLKNLLAVIPGLKKRSGAPHSVRYAFPKWAGERRGFDPTLITATLGHTLPAIVLNITNAKYFHGQTFTKRRKKMMAGWEQFLLSHQQQAKKTAAKVIPQKTAAKIIPLRRSASA
jgi:integrase